MASVTRAHATSENCTVTLFAHNEEIKQETQSL